jgi:hypothetical protein
VQLLNKVGFTNVDVAANGQLALDFIAAHPKHYYGVLLLDLEMPVMGTPKETNGISYLVFYLMMCTFPNHNRRARNAGSNGANENSTARHHSHSTRAPVVRRGRSQV